MTRAEGNLVGEVVRQGIEVRANRTLRDQYRINTNDRFDVENQDRFIVTRVFNESLQVRSLRTYSVRVNYSQAMRNVSFTINREFLMFEDPNYVPPPPPRKLGTMPAPDDVKLPEGIPLIGIDHPGIQWLFDDLGAFAEGKHWCDQYDNLCREMGIPGRPRDFNVTRTMNGIQIRASIKARSQAEANELFTTAMSTPAEATA